METDCIHFKDTGYFSKIICDYLAGDEKLNPFYQYKPQLDSFKEAINNKSFSKDKRETLKQALLLQYGQGKLVLDRFTAVQDNLNSLTDSNCYTVTTGHQLCLFTGPLYFIYKIVSTIKLAQNLKEKYPDKQFVPIYWMATEDHDFAEINHFKFQGKKFEWDSGQTGAVGRMKLDGMLGLIEDFENDLEDYSTHAASLNELFQSAYLQHDYLADTTRYLVNKLFGEYGVVVVDGDDKALKSLFAPIMKEELLTEFSSHQVEQQSQELAKHYKIQVNPREINLFYLKYDLRERIVKEDGRYFINDTDLSFSEEEILEELEAFPEHFSPNVLLRPLYQETILPNLAYIGGGGELAYWFQLKSTFDLSKTAMPMLILRNSVMWMNEKQSKYFKKLDISLKQLFKEEGVLIKEWVKQNAKVDLSLEEEFRDAQLKYVELAEKAEKIDKSLAPHVEAVWAKQRKALKGISEKLIRAERKQNETATDRIHFLKNSLYPNGGLQERSVNFSEIYLQEGPEMIAKLLEVFEVPTQEFLVVR